jgi:hypothetical protein
MKTKTKKPPHIDRQVLAAALRLSKCVDNLVYARLEFNRVWNEKKRKQHGKAPKKN